MGDVLGLIEKVEENIDRKKAEEMQRKLLDDDFTLEDFRDQIEQLRKTGAAGIAAGDDAADGAAQRDRRT